MKPAINMPRCAFASLLLVSMATQPVMSQDIYSVSVDRAERKIIVRGVDLDLVGEVVLGGVTVPPLAPVSSALMEIPFSEPVYTAVQWPGTYNLIFDGGERLSVYIAAPILAPPPEPPIGGPDCGCIPGWEVYRAFIAGNEAWCQVISDGNQIGYVGSSNTALFPGPTPWLVASAFDSDHPTAFDYADPGAARSFCALDIDIDGVYEVAEPVTNSEQHEDCVNWLFANNVCL